MPNYLLQSLSIQLVVRSERQDQFAVSVTADSIMQGTGSRDMLPFDDDLSLLSGVTSPEGFGNGGRIVGRSIIDYYNFKLLIIAPGNGLQASL